MATPPRVLPGDVRSMVDAWRIYDEMMSDERMASAEEPADIAAVRRSLTLRTTFAPNVWTDAYLAPFARSADIQLVTFDRGFGQYPGLKFLVLS